MVKEAQEQSIKGTASVVATSRSVGPDDAQSKAKQTAGARPKGAASSAADWQQMVAMANKIGAVEDAKVDQAKVRIKVCVGEARQMWWTLLHLHACVPLLSFEV